MKSFGYASVRGSGYSRQVIGVTVEEMRPSKKAGKVRASYAIIEGTGGDIMINNLTGVISN
jgi:hypothetical protein